MPELWNAYTAAGELTDTVLIRGEQIPKGLYHLVCEVLVRHIDGSFLCMKRSADKEFFGGYYEATAGGSALFGETPLVCMKRELLEETGIFCEEFTEIGRRVIEESKAIFYNYICTVDCDKAAVSLQEGETEGYTWMSEAEFVSFINSGEMIETQKRRYLPYFKAQGWIKNAIGQTVTVTVDRPLGSYHPEYPDLYYPVNYGYIAGEMAADGEEQDAYILGVKEPISSFTGVVAAIVHRADDVEEKWIAAPENLQLLRSEIEEQIRFQERYFDSKVIM